MGPSEDRFRYDSYCGIYCGACGALMAAEAGAHGRRSAVPRLQVSESGGPLPILRGPDLRAGSQGRLLLRVPSVRVRPRPGLSARWLPPSLDHTGKPCRPLSRRAWTVVAGAEGPLAMPILRSPVRVLSGPLPRLRTGAPRQPGRGPRVGR